MPVRQPGLATIRCQTQDWWFLTEMASLLVPGAILGSFCWLYHLIVTTPWGECTYIHPHFTEEETEAERDRATCPKAYILSVIECNLNPEPILHITTSSGSLLEHVLYPLYSWRHWGPERGSELPWTIQLISIGALAWTCPNSVSLHDLM